MSAEEAKLKPEPVNNVPEQDKVEHAKAQPEPGKVQPTKIQPEEAKIQPGSGEHELNRVVQRDNVEPELDNVAQPINVQSECDKALHQGPRSLKSDTGFETNARPAVPVETEKKSLNEKAYSNATLGGSQLDGDKNSDKNSDKISVGNANEDVEEFVPLPDDGTIQSDDGTIRSLPQSEPPLEKPDSLIGASGAVESSPQGRYLRYPEKLGSGQYKDVYRAYDTQEGIEVAWNAVNLNNLPKQEKLRIMNEVRLLQNLDHMNLVLFHGSWLNREAQQVVFVTEFLVNGSLKEFISKIHVIRWRVVKRWSRQILRGLGYLHSQHPPIIHRDLKCDNIFINGHTGDLRIGDLGLSTSSTRTDKRMSVLGTPEFMAPEMYDEAYNEKVDIYAFGMCLMEMITKERPYAECSNAAQIYKKVVYRKEFPAALKHIQNKRARDFIALCLNHSPDARPSATDLLKHEFLIPNEVEDNEEVILMKTTFPTVLEEDSYDAAASPLGEHLSAGISNLDDRTQASDGSSVRSSLFHEEGGGGANGMDVSYVPCQPNNGTTDMPESLSNANALSRRQTVSTTQSSVGSGSVHQHPSVSLDDVKKSQSINIGGINGSFLGDTKKGDKSELGQMLRDMPGNESQMRKVNLLEGRAERTESPDGGPPPIKRSYVPRQPNNGTTDMSESLSNANALSRRQTVSTTQSSVGSGSVHQHPSVFLDGVKKSKSINIGGTTGSFLGDTKKGDKSELGQMLRDMPGNESQMRKVNLLDGRAERTESPDGGFPPIKRSQTTTSLDEGQYGNLTHFSSLQLPLENCSIGQNAKNAEAPFVWPSQAVARSSTTRPKVPKAEPLLSPMQSISISAPVSAPVKPNASVSVFDSDSAPNTLAPPVPTQPLRERSATSDSSTSLPLVSVHAMHSNSKDEKLECDTKVKYASSQGAEVDVLRLVMHAHMDGRLQEVEFDFHLDHDNDVEVAEEMIKELKLPETELDHIAETIRSLAYGARTASFKRSSNIGGSSACDVAPSEGVGDKEHLYAPSRISPTQNTLGTETADTPRQQQQQHQSPIPERRPSFTPHQATVVSNVLLTSAFGGQNTISGDVNQSQQPRAALGGNLPSHEDPLVNIVRPLETLGCLSSDDEMHDLEVDEAFEKEREKYEKRVRTAQKAYEARQDKLVIAQKDCIDENRRMQEKFRKTCEGFEQKKHLMAVEFEQRMNDFTKEWIEIKQKARVNKEQNSQKQQNV